MRKFFIGLCMIFPICLSTSVSASVFTSAGTIVQTLSDNTNYGQCMVKMDAEINNGCPSNWVSLDCKGTYVSTETGERNYATALMAAALGKKVSMQVDNTKTHDTYCVAHRFDVIF